MRDALTAARQWQARPSTMLGALDLGEWSEADRYLAQAMTLHDGDLCPCGCGFYLDETTETDAYEVRKVTCWAKATLEQDEKDGPDRQPGEIRYLVDMSAEDTG